MKRYKFLLVLFISFTHITNVCAANQTEQGGSWSSGGGEILEHAQNPWFIKINNIGEPIYYCVMKGPDFSQSQTTLKSIADSAINWWKSDISNAHIPTEYIWDGIQNTEVKVHLNTNWKRQEQCNEKTDLQFQFGYLDETQKKTFKDLNINLRKYAALTIRTEYDKKLKGKGFIYISPDRGDQSIQGQNVAENVWSDDFEGHSRLQKILVHELGHVFGVHHSGTADKIMFGQQNLWMSFGIGNSPKV